jgi:hypothetical protein
MRRKVDPYIVKESTDVRGLIEEAASGHYKTTVLDHGTGLQDLVLKEVLGLEKLPEQKSWGMATQQQYGQCTQQCKEIMRALLDLQCNRVIVAQERTFDDTDDEESLKDPFVHAALTPSLVGWLGPACDDVCQAFIRPKMVRKRMVIGKKVTYRNIPVKGEVDYCLRLAPDGYHTAKVRGVKATGGQTLIVDPTYSKFLEALKGGTV